MTSRRAFLAGLPAAAAMVTLPASAVDNLSVAELCLPENDPADRVSRLMYDLSDALADYCRGTLRAIVEPSSLANGVVMLQGMHGDANLQRFEARPTLPPGFAVMHVGDRWVSVDTASIPQQLAVVDEDSRTDELPEGIVEHVSMPERGAEYVAVTHDGRIVITRLEQGLRSARKRDPRIGYMAGSWNGQRASYAVTVLGKVVSEG